MPNDNHGSHNASVKWSVVSTVRAPQTLVDEFVRFYLHQGADSIHLFFDDEKLHGISPLHGAKVHSTLCNDDYWKRSTKDGRRPEAIEKRQYHNHGVAREQCKAEWLLHVDIDELIFATRPVGQILAEMPKDVFSVLAPPREAVFIDQPSEKTMFRTPFFKNPERSTPELLVSLFGEQMQSMSYKGLWGHGLGKTFVRSGHRIRQRSCHKPIPADETLRANVLSAELELLHFEGMTFTLFREKIVRRINREVWCVHLGERQDTRLNFMWQAYRRSGDQGLLDVYHKMHVFERNRLQLALAEGYVAKRELEWPAAGELGFRERLAHFSGAAVAFFGRGSSSS